jgi:hypothetical protein
MLHKWLWVDRSGIAADPNQHYATRNTCRADKTCALPFPGHGFAVAVSAATGGVAAPDGGNDDGNDDGCDDGKGDVAITLAALSSSTRRSFRSRAKMSVMSRLRFTRRSVLASKKNSAAWRNSHNDWR